VKLLPRFKSVDEDEEDRRIAEEELKETWAVSAQSHGPKPLPWWVLAGIWAAALVPRLFALFFLTSPENPGDGWHGDVYHHWQIAYLTKEIGLWDPNGPRLWDLKGLDYFWGVLHPLLIAGLFFVTGSADVVIPRLVSVCFGALTVVLIFSLCRRYWGTRVAIAAGLFAALLPTSVFIDSTGFLEPMGIALVLLGIWLWPRRGLWTGVAWGLAAMARAEAWIFSLGMLVATYLRRAHERQRLLATVAWVGVILVYMKVLLDRTGNPIYPVYWNLLANIFGKWEFAAKLTPDQMAARPFLVALMLVGLVGLAWSLWKRPPSYMFLSFGFGYLAYTGLSLGLTSYLKSWESWFWQERFFLFPYEFAGVLLAIALLGEAPRRWGRRMIPIGSAAAVVVLFAAQAEWAPILSMYNATSVTWNSSRTAAAQLMSVYNQPAYRGRVLNIPPDKPAMFYAMVQYHGLEGRHVVGQLYDPFYYFTNFSYTDHPAVGDTLMQCWLTSTHTRLWAVDPQKAQYRAVLADHPEWFTEVGLVSAYGWLLEDVQVPAASAADCTAADKLASG
jgi:Dolichyl-phosphate-mannose-protein mannosyltransferase